MKEKQLNYFRQLKLPLFRKKKKKVSEKTLIEQERKFVLTENKSFYSREAYNTLRTNILFSLADVEGCKVILITSAMQGEGKSITAVNLAISLAETSGRVLVVDCDMRRPKVGRLLQMKADAGLSNMLIDMSLADKNILRFRESVDVILAGSIPPNPSELLGSQRMFEVLGMLKEKFDYIFLDLPPVLSVSDPLVITKNLDGIIVVTRHNTTRRSDVNETVRQLKFTHVHILGFVYNSYGNTGRGYYYRNKYYRKGGYYKNYYKGYYKRHYYSSYKTHHSDSSSANAEQK